MTWSTGAGSASKNARQRVGIGGVEGRRAARADLVRGALEALGVARREHDLGALGASEPRGLEPDARRCRR